MILRPIRFLLLTSSLVLVAISGKAAATAYKMTSIDYPNAIGTNVLGGINDRGDIVGAYTDPNKKVHGFLFSNGTYTTIDVPGAAITQARGINSRGDIVGTYQIIRSCWGSKVARRWSALSRATTSTLRDPLDALLSVSVTCSQSPPRLSAFRALARSTRMRRMICAATP